MASARSVPFVLCTLLLSALLAGCAEPAGDVEPADAGNGTVTITSPEDYAYLENGSKGDAAHVHDYWGGKQRLEVMNAVSGWGTFVFTDHANARFRPPAGSVIPQGTQFVHVTFTWTEDPLNTHAQPELWVQTQADNAPAPVAPLAQGETVTIEVADNAQNDLPHQTLSAWVFDWVITPTNEAGFMRYEGEISVHVVAERGLEIPLYPGHPDKWQGAGELPLLDVPESRVIANGNADDGQMCLTGCFEKYAPVDGAIVPQDAHHVEVVLSWGPATAVPLGLAYHGADTREFTVAEPVEESEGKRVYHIPVGRGMGDGPYAAQSLWEFMPVAEIPDDEGVFAGTFTLAAKAVRGS